MARNERIPLGGTDADFDSKRSRVTAINAYLEVSKDEPYVTFRGVEGLEEELVLPESPIRSNFLVSRDNRLYVVAGVSLYEIDPFLNVTNLGFVGGADEAQIITNGVPENNQLLILNGTGQGYTYNDGGLIPINDPNFLNARYGTILNEIFWLVKSDSNQFFGSALSDGQTWPVDRIATAEESPDKLINIIAKRSNLYLLNERTVERWIASSDVNVPVRVQKGATYLRGILAPNSLADCNEGFAWLADDKTVRAIFGDQMIKISDLDLEQRLNGNGTAAQPEPPTVSDAIGFYQDSPSHKIYYLTFPSIGLTWGYDFVTGKTHIRESQIDKPWRVKEIVNWNQNIYGGDRKTGQIWRFSNDKKGEGDDLIRRLIRLPSITRPFNFSLPLIELDMEVGQPENYGEDAKLSVRFSKDGYTFKGWGDITFGELGQYGVRVPLRHFGQVIRNKDFILELSMTDPARFQLYAAYADII